jgi:hypothetical protein
VLFGGVSLVPVKPCRLVQSLLVLWSWNRPLSYCVVRPPDPDQPTRYSRSDGRGTEDELKGRSTRNNFSSAYIPLPVENANQSFLLSNEAGCCTYLVPYLYCSTTRMYLGRKWF